MKTKLEIIDETVKYYSENPRAVSIDGCDYITHDGRKCAVGRVLIDAKAFQDKFGPNVRICHSSIGNPDIYLQEEYRGHKVYFWIDLQILHDFNFFWEGNKLSSYGQEYVDKLKEKYS